jgi:DNA-binding NarL/FixJ family response regulator
MSPICVGKAVVIVRDADVRALVVELLEEIGLDAVVEMVIPSGVDDPVVVVTDLGPNYDPAKARAAMRRLHERWPETPVVLLTSHRVAAEEPDQLGAEALILKPFDMDDLTSAVTLLIAGSRTPEQDHRLHSEA